MRRMLRTTRRLARLCEAAVSGAAVSAAAVSAAASQVEGSVPVLAAPAASAGAPPRRPPPRSRRRTGVRRDPKAVPWARSAHPVVPAVAPGAGWPPRNVARSPKRLPSKRNAARISRTCSASTAWCLRKERTADIPRPTLTAPTSYPVSRQAPAPATTAGSRRRRPQDSPAVCFGPRFWRRRPGRSLPRDTGVCAADNACAIPAICAFRAVLFSGVRLLCGACASHVSYAGGTGGSDACR